MRTEQEVGAAIWATYLINGDESGLTACERRHADMWLAKLGSEADVVDVGEPYFSWAYNRHTGLPYSGGEVADYTILYPE